MASTAHDYGKGNAPPYSGNTDEEKHGFGGGDAAADAAAIAARRESVSTILTSRDHTHRKLKPRHIQLIGIGGTIGTALYVQIGRGLINGGPASLFIAFTIW